MSTTGSPTGVAAALATALDTGCAVVPLTALQELVAQLSTTEPPTRQAGLRWTPGAALLVDGVPRAGDLQGTSRADYVRFTETMVLVRKRDALTAAGILDRERRMGGWGAVASEVGHQLGGTWTARSVRTLTGTLTLGIAQR